MQSNTGCKATLRMSPSFLASKTSGLDGGNFDLQLIESGLGEPQARLLRRGDGGGRQHAFRGVFDRNNSVSIDHAMISDHIAAVVCRKT